MPAELRRLANRRRPLTESDQPVCPNQQLAAAVPAPEIRVCLQWSENLQSQSQSVTVTNRPATETTVNSVSQNSENSSSTEGGLPVMDCSAAESINSYSKPKLHANIFDTFSSQRPQTSSPAVGGSPLNGGANEKASDDSEQLEKSAVKSRKGVHLERDHLSKKKKTSKCSDNMNVNKFANSKSSDKLKAFKTRYVLTRNKVTSSKCQNSSGNLKFVLKRSKTSWRKKKEKKRGISMNSLQEKVDTFVVTDKELATCDDSSVEGLLSLTKRLNRACVSRQKSEGSGDRKYRPPTSCSSWISSTHDSVLALELGPRFNWLENKINNSMRSTQSAAVGVDQAVVNRHDDLAGSSSGEFTALANDAEPPVVSGTLVQDATIQAAVAILSLSSGTQQQQNRSMPSISCNQLLQQQQLSTCQSTLQPHIVVVKQSVIPDKKDMAPTADVASPDFRYRSLECDTVIDASQQDVLVCAKESKPFQTSATGEMIKFRMPGVKTSSGVIKSGLSDKSHTIVEESAVDFSVAHKPIVECSSSLADERSLTSPHNVLLEDNLDSREAATTSQHRAVLEAKRNQLYQELNRINSVLAQSPHLDSSTSSDKRNIHPAHSRQTSVKILVRSTNPPAAHLTRLDLTMYTSMYCSYDQRHSQKYVVATQNCSISDGELKRGIDSKQLANMPASKSDCHPDDTCQSLYPVSDKCSKNADILAQSNRQCLAVANRQLTTDTLPLPAVIQANRSPLQRFVDPSITRQSLYSDKQLAPKSLVPVASKPPPQYPGYNTAVLQVPEAELNYATSYGPLHQQSQSGHSSPTTAKQDDAGASEVNKTVYGLSHRQPQVQQAPVQHCVPDPLYQCATCGKAASFVCSACKNVPYCSPDCQAISWRQGHSAVCCSATTVE